MNLRELCYNESMIGKLFSQKFQSITGAALVIGGASLASRLVGVLRDRVLASQFGAGETLDIYYAAFRIPDTLFQLLVAGALSAAFIPLFISLLQKNKEEAYQFATSVFVWVVFVVGLLSLLGILFTPWLLPFIVPGFQGRLLYETISVTRMMFLSPIFLGIASVFGSILQAEKRFFSVAIAPILYNIGIIFGAFFFAPFLGVRGLAWGVILGTFFYVLIEIPALIQSSFRFLSVRYFFHPELWRMVRLMIPRVLTLGVAQINFLVITGIGSLLGVGSLAVFNWAYNLQSVPLGIFAIPFSLAAFPILSEYASKKDSLGFVDQFSRIVRQILFFLIPSTLLLILLRAQIVRIVLGSGVFDWTATVLTMNTLAYLSLGLGAQGLIYLLARGFHAWQETKIPFYITLFSSLIHYFFAMYFAKSLGIEGLGFAFSLTQIVQCGLLWIFLRRKFHSLQEKTILLSLSKISLACIPLVFVTQIGKTVFGEFFGTETFVKIFFQGLLSGVVGIITFGVVGYFLRLPELLTILESLKKRWFRLEKPLSIDE